MKKLKIILSSYLPKRINIAIASKNNKIPITINTINNTFVIGELLDTFDALLTVVDIVSVSSFDVSILAVEIELLSEVLLIVEFDMSLVFVFEDVSAVEFCKIFASIALHILNYKNVIEKILVLLHRNMII